MPERLAVVKAHPLTTTSYAILGLLSLRSWTAYELAQQMERSLAFYWPKARSHLFTEPKNLVAHRLASTEKAYVGRRPRHVYSITPPGRRALAHWLADVPVDLAPMLEFEAMVRVTFADHGKLDDLRSVLDRLCLMSDAWHDYNRGRSQEYLEGGGPFPDRLALIAIVSQFVYEYRGAVRGWAHWAREELASWESLDRPDPTLADRVFHAHLETRAIPPRPRTAGVRGRQRRADLADPVRGTDGRVIWTAPVVPRAGGSLIAPESEMLRGLLDWHRSTLLFKCAGLSGEQLAQTPISGSNLSLLGLIRHLAKVERVWFRRRFGGEQIDNLYSTSHRPDADFEDVDPAQAETDYAQLLAEQEMARQATAGSALDTTCVHPDGDEVSLRMVFNHMIAEYARHNGHADLIRQCVDGDTGA